MLPTPLPLLQRSFIARCCAGERLLLLLPACVLMRLTVLLMPNRWIDGIDWLPVGNSGSNSMMGGCETGETLVFLFFTWVLGFNKQQPVVGAINFTNHGIEQVIPEDQKHL